jgi:HlyD family secretion protein
MAKKKKKSNNRILYILVGVVAVIIIFAIVGRSQGWIGKKKEIEVEVSDVARKTIIEKVSASGTVQPVIEVKISSEVSGEIIELAIEEGDSVQKGQFLLKVRPDNFISAVERAQANLNQQNANLSDAKARLARAEATFVRSELEYKRQKQLYDQKVISDADFELAEANYKIAKQDLESGKQAVEAARFVVKSSQASLADAQESLRLTTITAPMTGIVSKLNVELGETVLGTVQMQGTEIMRIADLNSMEVRVDVNENDIIRISLGDTTVIDVDSYSYMDKEFKGVVTQIANSANDKVSSDAVTEFEVRIKILNESYSDIIEQNNIKYPFRPGMTASVDIITETKSNIFTVPLAAVTTRLPVEMQKKSEPGSERNEDDDDSDVTSEENLEEVVFVYEGGLAKQVKVKTGISDFENIEILSGLEEGQKIISGPFLAVSKRIKNDDAVAPTNQEEERSEVAEEEPEKEEESDNS